MDDASATSRRRVRVREVQPGTAGFELVLALAARVLAQDRQLAARFPHAQDSVVLGAFDGSRCVGFLRYLVQVIGAEADRPAVIRNAARVSGPHCNGTRRGSAGSPGATRFVLVAR
jgi:hypothetical protein